MDTTSNKPSNDFSPEKRRYNQWASNETLEDFALRFTAHRARKWSMLRITNTALSVVSFLALEAIGGAITLNFGFSNAVAAISIVCLLIFFSGIPVCHAAAKYGIDIDLITRGAGFGYIGSAISSLIYAAFTFIFFALEAAIMSMALQIILNIPISLAYCISAFMVIPLVTHGISRISLFQIATQPIWLILQILPLIVITQSDHTIINEWQNFKGIFSESSEFNLIYFGTAAAVIFPLIAQNGEQADYLRFLPKTSNKRITWWLSILSGGPGWVIIGALKLLLGSFLAVLVLNHGIAIEEADAPIYMYSTAFNYIIENKQIALWVAGIFIVISQLKINVTNAYAGSIAWSNFFARITHNHPGRVVWLIFNVCIALLLMEIGIYHTFENILVTYSALVIAWMSSIVADLTVNRILNLRPKHLKFKRSELFDINPVGLGSMIIASSVGISSQLGLWGETIKALAPFISFTIPFITAPIIAYFSSSRFYHIQSTTILNSKELQQCYCCDEHYDKEDMTYCPFYQKPICSLCCSLENSCNNICRPKGHLNHQLNNFLNLILPPRIRLKLNNSLIHFILIFSIISLVIALLFNWVIIALQESNPAIAENTKQGIWYSYCLLEIVIGIITWLYVLTEESRKSALKNAQFQASQLSKEIIAHEATEFELKNAKIKADIANQAKTRYLSGVSHELRTPLNTVYGYAQIISRDESLPLKIKQAAETIVSNGEHLTDIIEGLLEISKIEARRLDTVEKDTVNLKSLCENLAQSFTLQANTKGLDFHSDIASHLPQFVITDGKRLRQILTNILSNAVKFTDQGHINFKVTYRNHVAKFIISDSGIGIKEEDIETIFQPFERGSHSNIHAFQGTGLGLAITKLLAEILGADISVKSQQDQGAEFTIAIMLPPSIQHDTVIKTDKNIIAYLGKAQRILIVDDQFDHRAILKAILSPLGFLIHEAENAEQALDQIRQQQFDLITLDVQMPGMNGLELAKTIRQQNISTPIIMISANVKEITIDNNDNEDQLVYNDSMTKPIVATNLLEKIATQLNIKWEYENNQKAIQTENSNKIFILPSDIHLTQITNAANIGHIDGIKTVLSKIDTEHHEVFIKEIEQHLKTFNLQAVKNICEQKT